DEFISPAYPGKLHLLAEQSGRELIPASGVAPYQGGTGRGQASDPGDVRRLPNLGKGYRWWPTKGGQEVHAWKPGLSGRYRVWLSWGCGWKTHTANARYLLETSRGRKEIARLDQRRFADGTGDMPGQPLWSGFHDAGVQDLEPSSRIVLRNGDSDAVVT